MFSLWLVQVRKLEAQIKGGRNTRAEENHLLKQLKDLERSRGQNLSIEDWNLKRKLKEIWNVKKELRELDFEISSLDNDIQYYSNRIGEVYPSLQQLRKQRYQNVSFLQTLIKNSTKSFSSSETLSIYILLKSSLLLNIWSPVILKVIYNMLIPSSFVSE